MSISAPRYRIILNVLEAPSGIPIHLDGEVFSADAADAAASDRIEVRVLPGRLQVIAAPVRQAR